jgi:hypothetical protein
VWKNTFKLNVVSVAIAFKDFIEFREISL